jgi:hypothetical protein
MADTPPPASAEDFRAARAHPLVVKLPASGLVVRLRRISLWELTAAGRIPDELTSLTLSNLAEDIAEAREQQHDAAQSRTMLRRRIELMNAVAIATLEQPAMTHDGAGETLAPDDLGLDDRIYIFGVASGTAEARNLAPFPERPRAGLAPVEDGAGLRAAPVEPAGGR